MADALPYWPRGLSLEEAAAYVGVSAGTFLAEIKQGIWPAAERRGRRIIWDRALLDAAYDKRSGLRNTVADDIDALDRKLFGHGKG
jgi:predicted DNA-binding transcriptional regulator AlpA